MRSPSPSPLSRTTSLEEAGVATPFDEDDLKASRPASTRSPSNPHPQSSNAVVNLWRKLSTADLVEGHGVAPLAESQRTDAKFIQNFTLWCVATFFQILDSLAHERSLVYPIGLR